MRELLRQLTSALEQGQEVLFCQVVETKGSTPQKAGALMVVSPEGGQLGTLGGGCVEAEVKQRAIRQLGMAGAEIHSFVLDHDYAWADGLICGGKMVFLVEALSGAGPAAYYGALRDLVESGQGFTEAIVIDPERAGACLGARAIFDAEQRLVAAWPGAVALAVLQSQLVALTERPRPLARGGVAYLPRLPRVRLVIVGAGHVGQAVAQLAAQVDFDIWVVDDRRQYCNAERFPMAERLVVGPIEQVLPSLEITPHTFALIVTRGHGHDQEALYFLAPTPAAYVGLIGSNRKIRLIFDGLRQLGIAEESLARVTAPVGFDIGSQTVPEIAVSIVAELVARRNLGPGGRTQVSIEHAAACAAPGDLPEPAQR